MEGSGPTENDALHLKRRVGLISGVALIVGTMIGNFLRENTKQEEIIDLFYFFLIKGSGIFVSPSGLLERTGSIGMSFVLWMACGLLSLLGR